MEVEIKAICDSLEMLQSVLKKKKGKLIEDVSQVDIYLGSPQRNLTSNDEYLRLRSTIGKDSGVFAYHKNVSDGVTKEYETEVSNIAVFAKILNTLGFTKLGTIEKKRMTFMLDEYKISLDDVKNIGKFVEIETECETEAESQNKREACLAILESLGIQRNKQTKVWLSDIATGKSPHATEY